MKDNDRKAVFMIRRIFRSRNCRKITVLAMAIFFFGVTETSAQVVQDTVIQNLLGKVNLDSLVKYVRHLSGEDSAWVSGVKTRITSRLPSSSTYTSAGNYIEQALRGFGLNVTNQSFNYLGYSGRNIIGVQYGNQDPSPEYIICAHWDAVTSFCADDNASGTAAVLEIARILSKRTSPSTIVYALWDREEVGLIGSEYYSNLALASGQNIKGVINLDMIAYDGNNDGRVEIHTRNYNQSISQANKIKAVDSVYSIAVNPVIINPGATASDHASFWDNGYSANLIIEAYNGGDFNPYYHTTSDRISLFNLPYFYNSTKLAFASLAEFAKINPLSGVSLDEKDKVNSFALYPNYPNPFNPSTTIRYRTAQDGHVTLKIYNTLGQEIRTLVSSVQGAGDHSIQWDGKDSYGNAIASGIYLYRLQAGNFVKSNKMTLMR